jgi:hypothetical protein
MRGQQNIKRFSISVAYEAEAASRFVIKSRMPNGLNV